MTGTMNGAPRHRGPVALQQGPPLVVWDLSGEHLGTLIYVPYSIVELRGLSRWTFNVLECLFTPVIHLLRNRLVVFFFFLFPSWCFRTRH